MADTAVEHELCGNCKREIPQSNYVMHTAHCARNITLCKSCNEPIARAKYEEHAKTCAAAPIRRCPKQKTPEPPRTNLEKSPYFQSRKEVEDKKIAERKARYLERHEKFLDDTSKKIGTNPQSLSSVAAKSTQVETTLKAYQSKAVGTASRIMSNGTGAVKKEEPRSNGAVPKASGGLMPCRYCDLELPRVELEEHENYCGSRTDKCLDCGELVMYKHKQVHLDTNHGFLKLNDGPAQTPPRHRRNPCKFCDSAIYYHNDLIKHRSVCRPKSLSRFSPRTSESNWDDSPKARSTVQENENVAQTGAVPRRCSSGDTNLLIFCETCKTSILQKDFNVHRISCELITRSQRRTNCNNYEYFPEARPLKQGFEKHGAPQTGALPKDKRPFISREIAQNNQHRRRPFKKFLLNDRNDLPIPETMNHVSTNPRRQRAHKSKRSTPSELSDKPEAEDDSIKHQSADGCDIDEEELVVDIPCEFCNEPILADYLILHQTGCRPDLAKKEVTDEDLATQEVKLPCEFCDELIYEFDLILHESGCMLQSAKKEATEFLDKPKNDSILHENGGKPDLAKKLVIGEDTATPDEAPIPKKKSILHENGFILDLVKREVSDEDAATLGEKKVCGEREPEVLVLRPTGCEAKKEVIEKDAATLGEELGSEVCGERKPEVLVLRRSGCEAKIEEDAATPEVGLI